MSDKHDEKAREMVSEYWGVLTAGKQERLTKAIAADRRQVERDALERAAKVCKKRAESRFDEHGFREPDTNATYYRGRDAAALESMDQEDEDCAAAIRALIESEKVQEGE